MSEIIKEIYQYREMLKNLVKKDLRTRYKGSFLGFLWTFLNPLLMLIVYSIVFSFLMRVEVDHYPIYIFIGLLPWLYFSNSINISIDTIISNSNLIKKIYFPRIILPISVILAGLVNYLLSLSILFPAIYISNIKLSSTIIYLPLIVVFQTMFTLGLAFIFSSLNVYFRDLKHIIEIIMMAWFYATPIIYPTNLIPKKFQTIINLNPMAIFIQEYKNILYYNVIPDRISIIKMLIISSCVFIGGFILFRYLEKRFAEEI